MGGNVDKALIQQVELRMPESETKRAFYAIIGVLLVRQAALATSAALLVQNHAAKILLAAIKKSRSESHDKFLDAISEASEETAEETEDRLEQLSKDVEAQYETLQDLYKEMEDYEIYMVEETISINTKWAEAKENQIETIINKLEAAAERLLAKAKEFPDQYLEKHENCRAVLAEIKEMRDARKDLVERLAGKSLEDVVGKGLPENTAPAITTAKTAINADIRLLFASVLLKKSKALEDDEIKEIEDSIKSEDSGFSAEFKEVKRGHSKLGDQIRDAEITLKATQDEIQTYSDVPAQVEAKNNGGAPYP